MAGMDTSEQGALTAARSDERAFRSLVEPYRRELRAHCYRMSGSIHDADDLVQESMLRAWRGLSSFEGRASLRTWLHRVTTNACLDALEKKSARVLPRELGPAADPRTPMAPDPEIPWLEPCPAALIDDAPMSPEARYDARESVALAFLTALQHLPPRQRAVLLLRDVLGHEASECAELLETTVASVNSALQRARETLAQRPKSDRPPQDETTSALLARYVTAWEQADVGMLVSILREDATLAMPPFASWLAGRDDIGAAIAAMVFVPGASGNIALVPIRANGEPAFAMYTRDRESGQMRASAIHVLTIRDGAIAAVDAFLDPTLFESFGLPATR
jgi:RNA polymerase sigma-70 factor (ECF subfamily)